MCRRKDLGEPVEPPLQQTLHDETLKRGSNNTQQTDNEVPVSSEGLHIILHCVQKKAFAFLHSY